MTGYVRAARAPSSRRIKHAAQSAFEAAFAGDMEHCPGKLALLVAMGPSAVHAALYGRSALVSAQLADQEGRLPDGGDLQALDLMQATMAGQVVVGLVDDLTMTEALRLVVLAGKHDHVTIAAMAETLYPDANALTSLMFTSLMLAVSISKARTVPVTSGLATGATG